MSAAARLLHEECNKQALLLPDPVLLSVPYIIHYFPIPSLNLLMVKYLEISCFMELFF